MHLTKRFQSLKIYCSDDKIKQKKFCSPYCSPKGIDGKPSRK